MFVRLSGNGWRIVVDLLLLSPALSVGVCVWSLFYNAVLSVLNMRHISCLFEVYAFAVTYNLIKHCLFSEYNRMGPWCGHRKNKMAI